MSYFSIQNVRAGAIFGEVQVSLFVAGAIFGEVELSFFVAGAVFEK